MKSLDSLKTASPHTQMSGVVRVTTGPPRGVSQALLGTVPASSPLGFSDPLHGRFWGKQTGMSALLRSCRSLLRRTALRAQFAPAKRSSHSARPDGTEFGIGHRLGG